LQDYGGRDLEFIIRQCQIGDETALSMLGKATFLETYAGTAEAADILAHIETEHSAESYRTWLQSDIAKIWVAETSVGRSAIGYAVALTSQNNGFYVEMEIKRLYVLYRFHRNGLGHSLMNEVLVTARKNRIAGLLLKVEKANQNAIDFYSRIGFRVVGEKPFRAGERDYAALVMRLAF
jgi:ribosomal protein S18 acetylase RimI-like enzyme